VSSALPAGARRESALPIPAPNLARLTERLRVDTRGRLFDAAARDVQTRLGMAEGEPIYAVVMASKVLRGAYDQAIAHLGISLTEYRALAWIRQSGPEGTQLRPIADACDVNARTMTGIIDSLVASGLVERVPDPHDRRAVIARLTTEGEKRVEEAMEVNRGLSRRLLATLSRSEREVLRDLSLRLLRAAAGLPTPPVVAG
jgi:DNA-binding MarR family transcriptional regulator